MKKPEITNLEEMAKQRERCRQHYLKNREMLIEKAKARYRLKSPEIKRNPRKERVDRPKKPKITTSWYERNKDRIANDPKIKARRREYYLKNRERESKLGSLWAKKNKDRVNRNGKRFREKHPLKSRAWLDTRNAIRRGELVRLPCDICGNIKSEAHHEDYAKPLEVRWLCRKHHHNLHREKRQNEKL